MIYLNIYLEISLIENNNISHAEVVKEKPKRVDERIAFKFAKQTIAWMMLWQCFHSIFVILYQTHAHTHTERCKTFNFTSTCSHFLHASAFVIAFSVHRQRKVWWHRCCCSASCTQFSCYCTHSMFTCTALFHSFIRFLCKQNVMFLKHDMCCIAKSSTLNETKNFLFFSPSSQLSIFARKKKCFKMKTLCKFHAESKSHAEWEKIVYEIALNVRDFASSYCWKCNSNKLNSFIEHKVLRWNVSMANDSTIFLSLSLFWTRCLCAWLAQVCTILTHQLHSL